MALSIQIHRFLRAGRHYCYNFIYINGLLQIKTRRFVKSKRITIALTGFHHLNSFDKSVSWIKNIERIDRLVPHLPRLHQAQPGLIYKDLR